MLDLTFSLRTYVADLFDEGHEPSEIVDILVRRAENNLSLRHALLVAGAKQAVRTYFTDARSEVMPIRGARVEVTRSAKVDRADARQAERKERQNAKVNRRTLLDSYALWGHTLLRDATKDDIRLSIEKRKIQVAGNLKAIRFEEAILAQMPENKTCGEALTVAKIDKLWMQHYGR